MSSLEITPTQSTWTPEQRRMLSVVISGRATEDELLLLLARCQQTGLSPFQGDLFAISRGGKLTITLGLEGFRKVANRWASERGFMIGNLPPVFYDKTGAEFPFPINNLHAVRYTAVVRGPDFEVEHTRVHRLEDFQNGSPFWKKSPANMLLKTCECAALRAVAPEYLGQVFAPEEFVAATDEKVSAPPVENPWALDDGNEEPRPGYESGDAKRHLVGVLEQDGTTYERAVEAAKSAWAFVDPGDFIDPETMLKLVETARIEVENIAADEDGDQPVEESVKPRKKAPSKKSDTPFSEAKT